LVKFGDDEVITVLTYWAEIHHEAYGDAGELGAQVGPQVSTGWRTPLDKVA
jgi:hypothetical protein